MDGGAAQNDYARVGVTLSKQALSEALAFGTEKTKGGHRRHISQPVLAAARFTERLLPGECKRGHFGAGLRAAGWEGGRACPDCYGTGQLWDEGLVEVVAQALHGIPQAWDGEEDRAKEIFRAKARAVLSALAGEVGR